MSHLFEKIYDYNFSSIEGPAIVVKNMTFGRFVIDEEGRSLESMAVAAIDPDCSICNAGIHAGKLVKIKDIPSKTSKIKIKNISESNNELSQTVALPEHNDSVQ